MSAVGKARASASSGLPFSALMACGTIAVSCEAAFGFDVHVCDAHGGSGLQTSRAGRHVAPTFILLAPGGVWIRVVLDVGDAPPAPWDSAALMSTLHRPRAALSVHDGARARAVVGK